MWTSNQMVALYILLGIAAASAGAWLVLRRTVRTRLRMKKILTDDPDINDWLVIFNWTTKIFFVPTIVASLLASGLMFLRQAGSAFEFISPEAAGGTWFVIAFINLLIEEYNITVKVIIVALAGTGFFLLWLHLLGWVVPFLKLFGHLALAMNGTGFLLAAVIGTLLILVSWLKGLFYYVTITPNYMNLQQGPTESGEHIGREDYNTVVDTSDFLERLMGFGRIIIIFKDMKRQPLVLLVWGINNKAQMLEKVRAKFAIDLDSHDTPAQSEPTK